MRVATAKRAVRTMGERRRVMRASGITLAILAMVGCSDRAGSGPLGVEERQDGLATAAVISGTMHHSGRLTTETGEIRSFSLPTHSFAVPIGRNGLAAALQRAPASTLEEAVAGLTPVVGVEGSQRSAPETRSLSFVDPTGKRHELRLVRAGRRVLRTEHRIDGELFSTVERDWREDARTWRLQSSSMVLQHGGRRVELSSTLSTARAAAATVSAGSASPVTNLGALPPVGYFVVEEDNEFYSCWGATLNLFAASGALASAIATGNIPAIIIATAYYFSALDNYNEQCR